MDFIVEGLGKIRVKDSMSPDSYDHYYNSSCNGGWRVSYPVRKIDKGVFFSQRGKVKSFEDKVPIGFKHFPDIEKDLKTVYHVGEVWHLEIAESYCPDGWSAFKGLGEQLRDDQSFVSSQQRINLRIFHAVPNELVEMVKSDAGSRLNYYGHFDSESELEPERPTLESLGELEPYFVSNLVLGRIGMVRGDDMVDFAKTIHDEKSFTLGHSNYTFLLAGLTTYPLIRSKMGGMIKWIDLSDAEKIFKKYFDEEISEESLRIGLKCMGHMGGFWGGFENQRPERVVGLDWLLDKQASLDNIEKALSHWEKVESKHNRFHGPGDMVVALKKVKDRVEAIPLKD